MKSLHNRPHVHGEQKQVHGEQKQASYRIDRPTLKQPGIRSRNANNMRSSLHASLKF
jgi:hypothetical protein